MKVKYIIKRLCTFAVAAALCGCAMLCVCTLLCGCSSDAVSDRSKTGQNKVKEALESGMAGAESGAAGAAGAVSGADAAAPEAGAQDAQNDQKDQNDQSSIDSAPLPNIGYSEFDLISDDGVDIDLTKLSSSMVYAVVYNIMKEPDDYIGKKVRMRGDFSYYYSVETGIYYYACIIRDATACCANGIEFELTDDYVYPDDYPEVNDRVTVVGDFDVYTEGEARYCTLRNAVLEQDK